MTKVLNTYDYCELILDAYQLIPFSCCFLSKCPEHIFRFPYPKFMLLSLDVQDFIPSQTFFEHIRYITTYKKIFKSP